MQKRSLVVLMLVALLLLATGSSASAAADETLALALLVKGDVSVQRADTLDWESLAFGGLLADSNRVRTGEDGFVAIAFTDDGSQVKIRPNSRIMLLGQEPPMSDGLAKRVMVDVGELLSDIGDMKGSFEVVTPTSVASVKGTSFWTSSDEDGNTTITTLEGTVALTNTLSGQTVDVPAGQTATSGTDGALDVAPTDPAELPSFGAQQSEPGEIDDQGDAGSGAPSGTAGFGGGSGAPGGGMGGDAEGEDQETGLGAEPGGDGGGMFSMNGAAGATVIDGQTYQYFSLRPDFSIGKFGVGLDLPIHMDAEGNIREEDWDDAGDILDKIFYMRWAQPGDPFYVRAGALTDLTIGYGLIMKRYTNALEWPQVRRVGLHSQVNTASGIGVEAMIADFADINGTETLDGPGLVGGRLSYELNAGLPFVLGANAIHDGNQYLGAPDEDDDSVPDAFDRFPGEDDDEAISFINNQLGNVPDANLQQLIDQGYLPDILSDYPSLGSESVTIVGADLGIPIIRKPTMGLWIYGQVAKILGDELEWTDENGTPQTGDPGMGYTVPGVSFNVGPVRMGAEYRIFGENFLPEFFGYSYDAERVTLVEDAANDTSYYVSKYQRLAGLPSATGYYADFGINVVNLVDLYAAYQHIAYDNTALADANKSLFGRVAVNTEPIPKLGLAEAYYQQPNAENLFDLDADGTTLGYRLGFEMSPGFMLVYDNKTIYRQGEPHRLMTIETQLSF